MKRFIAMICIAVLMLGLASCAEKGPPAPDSAGVMAAVYVGMADSHTIEVNVGGEPVALQLTGDALTQAPDFDEGDEVTIRYERRDGVLYALTIEKTPPAE